MMAIKPIRLPTRIAVAPHATTISARHASAGAPANALALRLGPGRASAEEQLQVCGQCHRLPEMISGGRAAITPDNPVIVRHQPVGLMQSACYTKSRGALSCSTCHNPHDIPRGEAAVKASATSPRMRTAKRSK